MKKTLSITLALLFVSLVSFSQLSLSAVKSTAAPFNSSKAETAVLTYSDAVIDGELGTGSSFTTNAFAYFPASDFTANIGESLYMISVGVGASASISSFEVCIWTDTSGHGANPIMSQTVTNLVDGWNQIALTSPYTLSTTPIFIGYRITTSGYSIGVDASADATSYGDMLQDPTDGYISHLGTSFGDLCIKGHVGTLEALEAELLSINNATAILTSPTIGITGTIQNNGSSDITSYDVVYSINGGTASTTYTVTPSAPISFGTTHTFAHSDAADFSVSGVKTVEVTISNINGTTDADLTNNTLSTDILVSNEFYTRNVVYEEATGTWCGYCVRGLVGLNTMAHDITDGTWIGIGVHNGDAMEVAAYDAAIGNFISGYPSGTMNRTPIDVDPGLASLQYYYGIESSVSTIAKIETANKSYDPTTRAWSIDVQTTFGMDLASADYNTALIIVENGVGGSGTGWDQTNYYSVSAYGDNGLGDMIDYDGTNYADLGSPVTGIEFNHVGRELVDGFSGSANSVPTSVTYNTPNTFSYSGTLSTNYRDWNVNFVALLIDNATGEIVNATEVVLGNVGIDEATTNNYSIYPNPTNGIVTVEGTQNAQVIVYNMIGAVIYNNENAGENTSIDLSSFAAGNYIVKIINNNEVSTKKIILTK